MRQMLFSFLSKERRHAVEPYVTRAELKDDTAIIEEPGNGTKEVTIQEAGTLLAHEVTVRLCQEATSFKEEPVVPFAWLCVAPDGFEDPSLGEMLDATMTSLRDTWPTRTPRKQRSHSRENIRRTNPALVMITGAKTPTVPDVVPTYLQAVDKQDMISPYAETSQVRTIARDPWWFRGEWTQSPESAVHRLARSAIRGVAEGSFQSQAVVICDGDNIPQPNDVFVEVLLALTCMSEASERSPMLYRHRVNLFPVVVERPEPTE